MEHLHQGLDHHRHLLEYTGHDRPPGLWPMVPKCIYPAQHRPSCLPDTSPPLSNEHHRQSCLIRVPHFCPPGMPCTSSPSPGIFIPWRVLAPLPQLLRPRAHMSSWFFLFPLPPTRRHSISPSCHPCLQKASCLLPRLPIFLATAPAQGSAGCSVTSQAVSLPPVCTPPKPHPATSVLSVT